MCAPDWKLGLCNVAKFPVDSHTHSELIELGLCMSWQDFLHIGLWSCMDNLVVKKPPKPMKLVLGLNDPKAVKVQRYHMVLQFIGENTVAQVMMQDAIMGSWLDNSDHPHFIDWGTLRTEVDFLLTNVNKNSLHKDMIPTWRYHHSEFPRAMVFGTRNTSPLMWNMVSSSVWTSQHNIP